ncbi:MAG: replication-associated recombination protein A, partial [Bacillota bacterium]|nr:replication-associated recombination protein A [Bacillota bacterium]
DLFDFANNSENKAPLAERMKPVVLDDFVGQEQVMERGAFLRRMIMSDDLSSLILHGPPGTGKTSLARVIANTTKADFIVINAVAAGIKDIKEAAGRGEENLRLYGRKTVLFIDEIHRFNKLQQDALLPYVETGKVILIGATTENPYFEVNNALLSRSIVCRLEKLKKEHILLILNRAIRSERGLKTYDLEIEEGVLEMIASAADGDARRALSLLENAVHIKDVLGKRIHIGKEDIFSARRLSFQNQKDNHYDVISAFIKSMRGSDPHASIYYLALLLESGEDPMFIARRVLICASEDVGNANPHALVLANAAASAVHQIGMPEARIILAQAVTYIACSPKSNAAYLAIDKAIEDIRNGSDIGVPEYLRDGTSLSLELKHALEKNEEYYKYPHQYPNGYVKQRYLPKEVEDRIYYEPKEIGEEKNLKRYLGGLHESYRIV